LMVTALAMSKTPGCLESNAGPSGGVFAGNLASDGSKSRIGGHRPARFSGDWPQK
jgi:hypothetical protein